MVHLNKFDIKKMVYLNKFDKKNKKMVYLNKFDIKKMVYLNKFDIKKQCVEKTAGETNITKITISNLFESNHVSVPDNLNKVNKILAEK